VPAAAVELFGMVGASNVANATKEFKPARSLHLLGRFGAASGVDGTKEFAMETRTDDRGDAASGADAPDRRDDRTHGFIRRAGCHDRGRQLGLATRQ
jgi:hypothetical protein